MLNLPNFYIALGTILIAVGGLLATYGWNARSDMTKKEAILKAAGAEYLIYEAIILDDKITETNEERLSQFVVYPRFHTTVLQSVISSGLFLDEKDKELYTRAVNLNEVLHEFNKRLAFSEESMKSDSTAIKSIRTKIRDGETRKSVLVKLEKFGSLLENKYNVNFKEQYFVKLEEDAT